MEPTGRAPEMMAKDSIWKVAACLLLDALVFLAFGGALRNGFVRFDDDAYVFENPPVAAGLTWAGARWAFTPQWAAVIEWENHKLKFSDGKQDVKMTTVGLQYRF